MKPDDPTLAALPLDYSNPAGDSDWTRLLRALGWFVLVYGIWSAVADALQIFILIDAGWRNLQSLERDVPQPAVHLLQSLLEIAAGGLFLKHRRGAVLVMIAAQIVAVLGVVLQLLQFAINEGAHYFPYPSVTMAKWMKAHPFAVLFFELRPALVAVAWVMLFRSDVVRRYLAAPRS